MPFPAGARLGPFEVEELLGTGGMGDVYRARDVRLGRKVALKVLRGDERTAGASLLAEARAASALNHPGIATVYEVGEPDASAGRPGYIAMEYVAGPTLDAFASAGTAGIAEKLDLAVQVAEALAEAHARGVVHRDVKPGNVVVTDGRRAKVLDFGLATRCCEEDPDGVTTLDLPAGSAAAGGLVGTAAYMAPEQALGLDVDARADVFALGAVLYELLSGQRAFPGTTLGAVLHAVLNADPAPLSSIVPEATPELGRIVGKMLEKDRARRYRTMRDVALDLAAARRELLLPQAPAGRPSGGAVAVVPFANITGRAEDDWLGTGLAETLAADMKSLPGVSVVATARVDEALRRPGVSAPGDEALAVAAARTVGARWVVAGAFQRSGGQLRITARVVDAGSGVVLFALKEDGGDGAVFDLQDRVVAGLRDGLGGVLGLSGPSPAPQEETRVVAAYEAYARGLMNLRSASLDGLERAVVLFERAVALDPAYGAAHVGLGWALQDKAEYVGLPELAERALAVFRRALERGAASTEAFRGLAYSLLFLRRDAEAVAAARKALEGSPGDAAALTALGRVLFVGFADFAAAADAFDRALAANPRGGWVALQLAHCRTLTGELVCAEEAARKAIELQEQVLSGKEGLRILGAHVRLAHVRALEGRPAEALEELATERAQLGAADHALRGRALVEVEVRSGSALRKLGREDEGASELRAAVAGFDRRLAAGADDPFTRYYAAIALALLGEEDRALDVLSEAARVRPLFTLKRALLEPDLASLRDTARFRSILAGAGLDAG